MGEKWGVPQYLTDFSTSTSPYWAWLRPSTHLLACLIFPLACLLALEPGCDITEVQYNNVLRVTGLFLT